MHPFNSRLRLVGLLSCLAAVLPLRAADPLPQHLESAPLEVQAQYIERMSKESLEEKLKVGKQRYEARIAVRQALHERMQAEVAQRLAEASGGGHSTRAGSAIIAFLKPTAIVVGCAVAMILVVQAWRRTSMA